MTVLFSRVAAAPKRSVAPNLTSLTRFFNALPRFQRAYITSRLILSRRPLPSSRGLATSAKTSKPTTKRARTTAAKKTAAKKTTAPKRKTAPQKKTAAKKKATKPKKRTAKPKKTVAPKRKRVLTPKAKERAARQKSLDLIKILKAKALSPPRPKAQNAYALYIASHPSSDFKEQAVAYKRLSASEKEQFQRQAEHNKMENETTYHNWILAHTPEQIRQANAARTTLRTQIHKLYPKRSTTSRKTGAPALKDARQVKRAKTAYTMYSTERLHGALHSMPSREAIRNIAKEWKEMSTTDKKTYEDLRHADKLRFEREYTSTYGHVYKSPSATLSP